MSAHLSCHHDQSQNLLLAPTRIEHQEFKSCVMDYRFCWEEWHEIVRNWLRQSPTNQTFNASLKHYMTKSPCPALWPASPSITHLNLIRLISPRHNLPLTQKLTVTLHLLWPGITNPYLPTAHSLISECQHKCYLLRKAKLVIPFSAVPSPLCKYIY